MPGIAIGNVSRDPCGSSGAIAVPRASGSKYAGDRHPVETIFAKGASLRRIHKEDLPLYAAWSTSFEAHGDYLSVEGFSLEECRIRFAEHGFWRQGSRTFMIELPQGGSIGTIHYWRRSERPDTVVLSIKIAIPELRGRGYGYAAQKALITHLFTQRKVEMVEMYTDMKNVPQQKCLAKLGFTVAESLRYEDQAIRRDGMLCRLTWRQFESLIVYTLPL